MDCRCSVGQRPHFVIHVSITSHRSAHYERTVRYGLGDVGVLTGLRQQPGCSDC